MKRGHHNTFGNKGITKIWMSKPGPDKTVSDAEIIEIIQSTREPFSTASEIASAVGLTPEQTNVRLKKLEKQNLVESKQVGQGKGWWVV